MMPQDVNVRDPFGYEIGLTGEDKGFTNEHKGLESAEERLTRLGNDANFKRAAMVLALAMGSGPNDKEDWTSEENRMAIGNGILTLPKHRRKDVWSLYQGGFSTAPDIIDKNKERKNEREIQRKEQGFKGHFSVSLAALDSLSRPQPESRIDLSLKNRGAISSPWEGRSVNGKKNG